MARTVPCFLRRVPRDDAAEVCADGGELMQMSVWLAIARDGLTGLPNDRPFSRRDVLSGLDISAGEPVGVLGGHIEVFARPFSQGTESLAGWIVKFCPGIFFALG